MHHEPHCHHRKHVSWGAILAGTFVAVGLTFLFNILTLGIGLSVFVRTAQGAEILTFSGLAWMVVGGYILLFISGWVAGRLVKGSSYHILTGAMHGFVVWTLHLIVGLLVISQITESGSLAMIKSAFFHVPTDTAIENVPHAGNAASAAMTSHNVGLAALATFFVLIVGALGSCIGAACGIRESKRCADKCGEVCQEKCIGNQANDIPKNI